MRKTILAAALALFAAPAIAQTPPLVGYGTWFDVPTPASEYTNQYMQEYTAGQPKRPPNTVYDARGLTFRFRISSNPDPLGYCGTAGLSNVYRYPLRPNAVDSVWDGGLVISDTDPDIPGWDRKVFEGAVYCNSAAFLVGTGTPRGSTVRNIRIDNVWDGIRIASDDCAATVGLCHHVISGVWLSDVIDDGVEIDKMANATISDSLFDGVLGGISSRIGGTINHSAETITLDGVLMRLRGIPTSRVGAINGLDQIGPLKLEPNSPQVVLKDTIIAFDTFPADRASAWSSGWLEVDCTKSSNVMLLWLPDTAYPPAGFPAVPACITVKTGQEARMIWQRARAEWIARHPEIMRAPGDPPAS